MSESITHIDLVQTLLKEAKTVLFVDEYSIIYVDSPDSPGASKPPKIINSIPDVLIRANNPDRILIGEAKTARDFEHRRTKDQLKDYLLYLSGQKCPYFMLVTPWVTANAGREMLGALKRKLGCMHVQCIVSVGEVP